MKLLLNASLLFCLVLAPAVYAGGLRPDRFEIDYEFPARSVSVYPPDQTEVHLKHRMVWAEPEPEFRARAASVNECVELIAYQVALRVHQELSGRFGLLPLTPGNCLTRHGPNLVCDEETAELARHRDRSLRSSNGGNERRVAFTMRIPLGGQEADIWFAMDSEIDAVLVRDASTGERLGHIHHCRIARSAGDTASIVVRDSGGGILIRN